MFCFIPGPRGAEHTFDPAGEAPGRPAIVADGALCSILVEQKPYLA